MQCQQVRELLRRQLLRSTAVARTFTGLAHGLDERDPILIAHNVWTLREVLYEFVDEEVLSRVPAPPRGIASKLRLQTLKQLGICHDDRLLPATCLAMNLAPSAQQHYDAPPTAYRPMREVAVVVVAVTVRGLVVLDDDTRTSAREQNVGDVPTKVFMPSGSYLLDNPIAASRQLRRVWKASIHLLDEEPLERVAKLMRSIGTQEPGEHIGQLLLVRAVVHHAKYVELLSQTPRHRRHQGCDHLVERAPGLHGPSVPVGHGWSRAALLCRLRLST